MCMPPPPPTPQVSYYDDLKQQMTEQAERNRAEFAGMEEQQRIACEGFRQGTYVRMEIKVLPVPTPQLSFLFFPLSPLVLPWLSSVSLRMCRVSLFVTLTRAIL